MTIGEFKDMDGISLAEAMDAAVAAALADGALEMPALADTPPPQIVGEPPKVARERSIVQLLSLSPETLLLKRWDDALQMANKPEIFRVVHGEPDLRMLYRRYITELAKADPAIQPFARLAVSPEVLTFLQANTPAVISGLYGSSDFAQGLVRNAPDLVGVRTEAIVATEFVEHSLDPVGHPLLPAIRAALGAVVPAVTAAALSQHLAHPPVFEKRAEGEAVDQVRDALSRIDDTVSPADAFAGALQLDAHTFRAIATDMAHRVVARAPRVNIQAAVATGQLEEFKRKNPLLPTNEFLLRAAASALVGRPTSDRSLEGYLVESTLGAPRERNSASHLFVGDSFGAFPELPDADALIKGLQVPHKITLGEGLDLYHPYLLFARACTVMTAPDKNAGRARKEKREVSLLELLYGLTPETMKTLRQVALGEAAVVGLDEATARKHFSMVATALANGTVLDGNEQTVVQTLLSAHVERPTGLRGKVPAAELLRAQREKTVTSRPEAAELPWVTGPRGLTLLLKALGADRLDLGDRLLHQSREVEKVLAADGLMPRNRSAAATLTAAPARRDAIASLMSTGSLLDRLKMKQVPMLSMPGLGPGETVEKDADASFRLRYDLARRAKELTTLKASPSAVDDLLGELQTVFGYYIFGRDAYSEASLPYSRSIAPAERLPPGIAETLSGKKGLIRTAGFGTRFDNSGRAKLLPDWRQPVDSAVVPPFMMATVRGDYLRTRLMDPAEIENKDLPTIQERVFVGRLAGVFSRQTKSTDFLADLRKWSQGLLLNVERKAGPGAAASMREVMVKFCAGIPMPHRAEAERTMLGQTNQPGSMAARNVDQYIAKAFLDHPLVSPILAEVNGYYPAVISRYPVIHHHSYVSVFIRAGSPEANTISIHPLVAGGLGADYDGDAVDLLASLMYSGSEEEKTVVREMLLSHSPVYAILNSASGTDLIFKFSLNASEGFVKANHCTVLAAGVPQERVVMDSVRAEETLARVMPARDQLLSRILTDPLALLTLQGEWLREIQRTMGIKAVRLGGYVVGDGGKVTTLSRLFLHEMLLRVADGNEKLVRSAVGDRYVSASSETITNQSQLERLLQTNCIPSDPALRAANPSAHLGAIYAAFYGHFSAEATTATHSAQHGAINMPEMLAYIYNDPEVAAVRARFEQRMTAIELAHADNVLSAAQLKSLLLRLENGQVAIEERDFEATSGRQLGLSTVLRNYRSAGVADQQLADQEMSDFLQERMSNPDYGLKPLMKAAVRIACERFRVTFGFPHMLEEQILTAKVKANDEVLSRFFMGTANLVGGEAVATTFGGLVGEATAERVMKSSPPAAEKAVLAKMGVPATGVAFKDYGLVLSGLMVTDREGGQEFDSDSAWARGSDTYAVADYAESATAMDYLAHQLTLRRLRVEPTSSMGEDARRELDRLLVDAVELLPFDRARLVEALKRVHALDPSAKVQVRSTLAFTEIGAGISATSAGYLPMAGPGGVRLDENRQLRRVPFDQTHCLGYPLGPIMAGALAEEATQKQLKIRHATGSGAAQYLHIGDWHKTVNGPFPQHSTFYRRGGDRVRAANPLSYAGLAASTVAMQASVKGVPDQPVSLVRQHTVIGDVEVFPGERFLVSNGKLVIGSDRPARWSVPVDNSRVTWLGVDGHAVHPSRLPAEVQSTVEGVLPSAVQLLLSRSEAAQLGLGAALSDPVASYSTIPSLGKGVSATAVGESVTVRIPREELAGALQQLQGAGLGRDGTAPGNWSIPATAEYVKLAEEPNGTHQWETLAGLDLARFRVLGDQPSDLGRNTPLQPGMIIDPSTGLATGDLDKQLERAVSGFEDYLSFIGGKPLALKAPLSLHSGTVESVKYLARRGESYDYEIAVRANEGLVRQVFRVPAGDLPCLVPGQQIDRGRPLTFDGVDLAERSALRPATALKELAQFLQAFSYNAGGRSPAPLVTDLLARALFAKGEFTSIYELAQTREQRTGGNPYVTAARAGNPANLFNSALTAAIFPSEGRVHAYPHPNEPIADQIAPVHAFTSKHEGQTADAAQLAQALAAVGLGNALTQPLVTAVKRLDESAARKAEKGVRRAASAAPAAEVLPNEPGLLER